MNTKNPILIIAILFLMGCKSFYFEKTKSRKFSLCTTQSWATSDKKYVYSTGYSGNKSDNLIYLVIQHAAYDLSNTIDSMVISEEHTIPELKLIYFTSSLVLNKNKILPLPFPDCQIIEISNGKIIKSDLAITREEFEDFSEPKEENKDYTLSSLEKFIKNKRNH